MESALDWHQAKALLDWYVELGAVDAVGDTPVDRYELARAAPETGQAAAAAPEPAPEPVAAPTIDQSAEARRLAEAAGILERWPRRCAASMGWNSSAARATSSSPTATRRARVMIVGEAPGRRRGPDRPALRRAAPGQLLDRMLAAIGLARDQRRSRHAPSTSPTSCPGGRPATARRRRKKWR